VPLGVDGKLLSQGQLDDGLLLGSPEERRRENMSKLNLDGF
jgi:hypothetical protein